MTCSEICMLEMFLNHRANDSKYLVWISPNDVYMKAVCIGKRDDEESVIFEDGTYAYLHNTSIDAFAIVKRLGT